MVEPIAKLVTIVFITLLLLGGGSVSATEDTGLAGGTDLLLTPVLNFEPVRLFYNGNPQLKRVALTFDDSPNPFFSEEILRILREKNVNATFFCIGNKCQLYPDLLVKILRDGHDIGNHSYSHPKLDGIPAYDWQEEILYTNRIIKRVLGYDCRLFRPPHGRTTEEITDYAYAHGMTSCWWTVNTGDYLEPSAEAYMSGVRKGIDAGGIILMHDGTNVTIEVLPELIDYLIAEGYELVTMSTLIGGRIVF